MTRASLESGERRISKSLLLTINCRYGGIGPTDNVFFFSSRRRHTRLQGDWSSDVCSPIWYLYEAVVPAGEFALDQGIGLDPRGQGQHGQGRNGAAHRCTQLRGGKMPCKAMMKFMTR